MKEITFSCPQSHGGLGDITLHAWHAEGYRKLGIPCRFFVGCDTEEGAAKFGHFAPAKNEVLSIFGQETVRAPRDNMIVTGGAANHYMYELRVDKGKNPRALVWSSRLPHNPAPIRPPHSIPDGDEAWVREQLEKDGRTHPLVLVFPLADYQSRAYPLAYFIDLCYQLERQGYRTAAFAPAHRKDSVQKFPFRYWGWGWARVMAAMKHAVCVVGNDSGPAHIAGTLGCRTVACIGACTNTYSHMDNVLELSADPRKVACVGCHFNADRGWRAACDAQCRAMMLLEPELVVNMVKEWASEPLLR